MDMIFYVNAKAKKNGNGTKGLPFKTINEAAAIAKAGDIRTAALSGGCYQNKLLTKLTEKELKDNGFKVLLHSMVPPNDGGIALGQALYGMNRITIKEDT